MAIRDAILPEYDQEMANTRKMLAAVPDGKWSYKPHSKSMQLDKLAGHIAEMPGWLPMTMQVEVLNMDGSYQPFLPKTNAELLAAFDKNVKEGREALAKATDEQFAVVWTLKSGDQVFFSMPRTAVVRSLIMNHVIHHRAQLGVYLRLNDVAIPGMYGPSADEQK